MTRYWYALLVFLAALVALVALSEAMADGDEAPNREPVIDLLESDSESGFTIDGNRLPNGRASFRYNPANQPAWITSTAFVAAAITGWNNYTPNLQLTYAGTSTATSNLCLGNQPDGQNTISWQIGGGIGLSCWWTGANGECDVLLGTGSQLPLSYYQGILAHELGHCVGLGHTPDTTALMYHTYHNQNVPQADDIAGICSHYGGCGLPVPTPTPSVRRYRNVVGGLARD